MDNDLIDTRRIQMMQGDAAALAAIRDETRAYYNAADIASDAPIFFWHGIYVKGGPGKEYEIPAATRDKYVETQPFPALRPDAVMSDSEAAQPYAGGIPAEGDAEALDFVRLVTRLYHEMADHQFPMDGEIRWFRNGLHVVSKDEKHVFQVPMGRVEDLVRPRPYPQLPTLVMTDAARHSLKA